MPKLHFLLQPIKNQLLIALLSTLIIPVLGCSQKSERKEDTNQLKPSPQQHDYEISKSEVSYTLIDRNDSTYASLSFYRKRDSTVFYHLNYQHSSVPGDMLKEHSREIFNMWSIAKDSIDIQLESVMVGYPVQYDDVLKSHIDAFINSDDWNVTEKSRIDENYQLVRNIMQQANVYSSIDSLLDSYGYKMSKYSTEKHGFVLPSDLSRLSYDSTLYIPLPHMVWIEVEAKFSE